MRMGKSCSPFVMSRIYRHFFVDVVETGATLPCDFNAHRRKYVGPVWRGRPPHNHPADLFHSHFKAQWVMRYQEVIFWPRFQTSSVQRPSTYDEICHQKTGSEERSRSSLSLLSIVVGLIVLVLDFFPTTIQTLQGWDMKKEFLDFLWTSLLYSDTDFRAKFGTTWE